MTEGNPEADGGQDLTDAEQDATLTAAMRKLYREMDEREMPGDPPFDAGAGLRDLKDRLREDAAAFRSGAESLDGEGFTGRTLDAIGAVETERESGAP